MRIGRLQVRDLRRFRDLEISLAPGLTIVRGPNEAGKSTIAKAIELGLAEPATSTDPALAGLRPWDADDGAVPEVGFEFTIDTDGGPINGALDKTFRGAAGSASLTLGSETTSDPAAVDARLVELTGIPSAAFFRSTALIRGGELTGFGPEATLRERLLATISAADRSSDAARVVLERALSDLNVRGERDPGRLRIAEEAVGRSSTIVEAGDAALAELAADRATAVSAEEARDGAKAELDRRRDLHEQAVRAESLVASRAVATERHVRYAEAVTTSDELARLHDTHPSAEPLPVLRQTVGRLRTLDSRIKELTALLSGEVKVEYELSAPKPTWRVPAILAIVAVASGIGMALVGQFLGGPGVLLPAGLAGAFVGAVLALVGIRRRRAAVGPAAQKQLAGEEIDRRLRGRSQLEQELRQAEIDTARQLSVLGLTDLAAADDVLAREEAHVVLIDGLTEKLHGLVGREPADSLPRSRDEAQREINDATAELERLDPEALADGAVARGADAVAAGETALEEAREAAAAARAKAVANRVDPDQVTGEAERLADWRAQLDSLQRTARIHEAALEALERAEVATRATATRYLEKRMVEHVARITDGRYRRIRIDDATLAVSVHSPEKDDWVAVEELSDGTVDQVHLAARLGMVRHLTGDRRPPLVLDDPFVTFDDARAGRAFALLRDLTRDHQVIYLAGSDRYDAAADSVVELPGPTAVDPLDEADREA